ncbi:MAG: hypothetical protein JKY66_00910 [Spongiibacteraceae bacterium]|nr:hypothetical protein [Spongiibacteraceae bacterium]
MANPFKYRADHVGKLIVDTTLQQARDQLAAGSIDNAVLQKAEDTSIEESLSMQVGSGIDIFSDGQLRREDYLAALREAGADSHQLALVAQSQAVTLDREIAFLKGAVKSGNVKSGYKLSVVSPGYMVGQAYRVLPADEAKTTAQAITEKLVPIVRGQLQALAAAKVPYIQLENPSYGYLLATSNHAQLKEKGVDPAQVFDAVLSADLAALESVERPESSIFALQLCKGAREPWYRSEGHDVFAQKLFSSLPVDRFNIDYGDASIAKADDFQALQFIPEGKVVSLGLINAASTALENADDIMDRLDEADEVLEQDNLAVCIQGDFSKHQDITLQSEKLKLAGVVARRYWGFEM